MSSQNAGELEGKPDYGLIFDDFPHCWSDFPHEYAVISNDYQSLFEIALSKITIEDLQKAREYGLKKYSKFNWRDSRGTADHDRFMAANRRSIYRHLVALRREDIDIESGCLHWALIALRCMIAIEYQHVDIAMAHEIDLASLQMAEYGDETRNRLTGEPIKKTIYDWSIVPEEFNWIAKNSSGKIIMHERKPCIYNFRSFVSDGNKAEYLSRVTSILNWEDSLEARPT